MLVVFDLDGTVVDSTEALLQAHTAAWESVGQKRPPDEEILDLIGLPLLETMRALGPEHDPEALAEVYSRTYVQIAPRCERLFDGMTELLSHPFRAAVATGKSQRGADRVIHQLGLNNRFEVVLGADSVARPKPNPDLLHAIMNKTSTTKDDLVMIGDTTYDLEMAHAAGVRSIGVSWGHHSSERLRALAPVVDHVSEIWPLLQR